MTFGWPQLIMVMLMTAQTVRFWMRQADWRQKPITNLLAPLVVYVPLSALLWWGGFFG